MASPLEVTTGTSPYYVIGHIHGAIAAAIVAAMIAPTGHGNDRPVYTPCNCTTQQDSAEINEPLPE